MNYQYLLKTNALFSEGDVLTADAHEIKEIGACVKCAGLLKSLSSHHQNEGLKAEYYIVSSCTKCSTIYVHQYDSNWSWIDENEPELIEYDPAAQKITTEDDAGSDDQTNQINQKNPAVFYIPVYDDIVSSYDDLNQISRSKLKSVFSEAEIQTLIKKSKKEKYIRQYYHRAKKKYKDFEEIFGIYIDI